MAKPKSEGVVLSAEQRRRRRTRSIVLALVLAGFAILFYVVTIVKLGPQVLNRPI
jgi:predicted nucleic acid-binding Zn ribbon protein